MREIIVDNFAGGGGASTGIELAIGRSVDIAINHDENAVAMHTTNHPDTLHYCESVYEVRPKVATAGRPVALAWFSPDCRHFSKAKGAKPVEKAIRGLAWVVLRWGLDVEPRVMKLENVEEFKAWGPLLREMPFISHADRFLDEFIGPPEPVEQRPDPARIGETFNAFVAMLTTGISASHPALAECCEFLNISLDSEDCDGLVTVDGITYRIVDIGMRMLQPHELYRAQGFPEWYIIDQDYRGKKYAKDKQVARCGNAVPPPFAEALVRANLPELCQSKQIAA